MQQTENHEANRAAIELSLWFSDNRRPLPWRDAPTPYRTWLCEIIMQQTRIEQGIDFWRRFVETFPTVHDLAQADEEHVMKLWQGLGYYSRARNLHRAAKVVVEAFNGSFPQTAEALQSLPGVGPYTAAAIASICFKEPVAAVDGNVQRVIARYMGIDDPVDRPNGRKAIEEAAFYLLNRNEPGMHNEAMMELGALVCTPKNPNCEACPLMDGCSSAGNQSAITKRPTKAGKTKTHDLTVTAHVITNGTHVAVRERTDQGIWKGLWEFPSSWTEGRLKAPPSTLPAEGVTFRETLTLTKPHLLSHRRIWGHFTIWEAAHPGVDWANDWLWMSWEDAQAKPWPKMTEKCWKELREMADQS